SPGSGRSSKPTPRIPNSYLRSPGRATVLSSPSVSPHVSRPPARTHAVMAPVRQEDVTVGRGRPPPGRLPPQWDTCFDGGLFSLSSAPGKELPGRCSSLVYRSPWV